MRLNDIRATFLNYFKDKGHTVVDSAPLVPKNDPTLMFTSAGMVPFKDVFTGAEKRPYNRATSSQKCLRAGGKHNDLDNVGYTTRHHTFFEMLGNFSFGDYFKEEAISFAWDMVTKSFALDPARLLVTVHASDEEAATLWKKISGFSDNKILRIDSSDNFWSMGDTGPCGPCTEIFFDHGDHIAGGPPGSPDEDGDRFTEIWNLVFMQYERFEGGRMVDLPKPSVDTGMGLERIGAVLQGVHSNFETDLFQSLIQASKDLTRTKGHQQSHQVIADHLRASCFLLADGILPSNEGRGYVLRRIMRRAMRHAHLLGAKDPLMHRLVPTLLDVMGEHYPELNRAESLMTSTLQMEEEKFRETLGRGMKLLQDNLDTLAPATAFPGDVAFKLYDTYGFPVDLTADVLRGQGRTLDMDGFDTAMNAQKALARASWSGSGEAKNDKVWFDVRETAGTISFLGYETLQAEGTLKAVVHNGTIVDHITPQQFSDGDTLFLVFDQTPFYGESGGQMGDKGEVFQGSEKIATVGYTQKPLENLIVHRVESLQDALILGQVLTLNVDEKRRRGLKQHHSVTHLLHSALRHLLGDHVTQKGSLVEEDRLRFDFTHPKGLSFEDIKSIEMWVNDRIQENHATQTMLQSPEEAMQSGAMALFGEKYGDIVRVVSMGDASIELCGGTHVKALGDIGFFKITSESGISAGIRRIEAVAGMAALSVVHDMIQQQNAVCATLKTSPSQLISKVEKIIEDQKILSHQIASLKQKLAGGTSEKDMIETIGGHQLLIKHTTGVDVKDLKSMMDALKKRIAQGIVFLSNVSDHRVTLLMGTVGTLPFDATSLIREISPMIGGKGGGGRPDLVQAGGDHPQGIEKALTHIRTSLSV